MEGNARPIYRIVNRRGWYIVQERTKTGCDMWQDCRRALPQQQLDHAKKFVEVILLNDVIPECDPDQVAMIYYGNE